MESPHADNIAQSTVSLVRLDNSGNPLDYGTGFIIHGSEAKDGLKRVVTAFHVSDGSMVQAYSSSGEKLGLMKSAISHGTLSDRATDVDVLRFTALAKAAAHTLKGIRGLDIDPAQSASGILTGLFEHGAPLPGTSGAAAVGHDTGFVKGIMTDYFTLASIPEVKRKGPHFYTFEQGQIWSQGKPDEEYTVKEKVRWFAIALTSPKVLAALGKAGKDVRPADVPAQPVDVAGFTSGYCMAAAGVMKQLDPSDPADFDLETPARNSRNGAGHSPAQVAGWDNPVAAIRKVRSVVAEAQKLSPHASRLSAMNIALGSVGDISRLPLVSAWNSAPCQNPVAAATMGSCRLSVSQVMDTLAEAAQASQNSEIRTDLKAVLANLPYGYIRASWFNGNLNARLSR